MASQSPVMYASVATPPIRTTPRSPQKRPKSACRRPRRRRARTAPHERVAEIVGDFVAVRGASPPRRLAEPFEVTTRHENVPSPAVRRWSTTQLKGFNPCRRWPSPPSDTRLSRME